MRLRLAVVLALVLGVSSSAFAQPMIEYKAIGGVGFGTLSFDDEGESEFFDGARTGFIIGGGGSFPVGNTVSIGVELLYNQKGAKGSEVGEEATIKLDYIEIPIVVNFPFAAGNTRPFVYGGFAPAFAVSRKVEFEEDGFEGENDLDDELKSFDNSLVLGGGVRFGQMAAEVRYNLGLQNIADDDELGDVKTRQFSILFSYFFGGN